LKFLFNLNKRLFKNLEISVNPQSLKKENPITTIPFFALYGMITLKKHSYLIIVVKANLMDLIIQK